MDDKEKMSRCHNPLDYLEGSTDPDGTKIEVVYTRTDEYVIYRGKKGKIQYYIADENVPKEERIYAQRILEIGSEMAKIYSLQPEELRGVELINTQIGRAMSQCIEGRIDAAKNLLKDATRRLIRLRCLQTRLNYLLAAAITALIPFIILMLIKLFNLFSNFPEISLYSKILTFGALGGFLSVSLNVWQLDVDLDAGRIFNFAAGCSRIFIAVAAAFVAYFAIKAKLILGTIQENHYGTYVALIAAGFSESFIPNILGNLSQKETEKETEKVKKTKEDTPTACKI